MYQARMAAPCGPERLRLGMRVAHGALALGEKENLAGQRKDLFSHVICITKTMIAILYRFILSACKLRSFGSDTESTSNGPYDT